MFRKYLILILILQFWNYIYPQTDTTQLINDKLIQLIEDASEDIEDGQFYEIIEQLTSNPIDLNTATKFDLLKIPFLTTADVNLIISARKKRKGFKSLEELNSIKNLHPDLITIVKPFLTLSQVKEIESRTKRKKYAIQLRTRFISDLQDRAGFKENKFYGNKLKAYNRIKADLSNFRFGLLAEKDPGESSYYDHFAGFIQHGPIENVEKIILGDFNYEFGQGLVAWSPYAFSKGVQTVSSPIKRNRNFYTNSSSEENKFFRGAAVSLKMDDLYLNTFYSYHDIDATLNDLEEVNNYYLTGYHRTELEKSKKHVLNEQNFGISLNYYFKDFINIGFLHFINNYDKPFTNTDETSLSGKNFSFSSIGYNFIYGNLSIIGETAYNSKSFASINNFSFSVTKNIDVLISYRNYSANYFNTYANGFGESSNTQNEIGYYLGTSINSVYGKLNFYYDIFRAPSASFNSDFPSTGNDFLLNFNSNIFQNAEFNFKLKREQKEITSINELNYEVDNQIKSNYRIELIYKLSKSVMGKTRFEYVNYSLGKNYENGFLTYQEIKYVFVDKISLVGRIILFDTKSYNTRLYEFENDLRGVMTNLPMFGEGFRWYVLLKYKIINDLNLFIKYSETFKPNVESISSGNSEIIGNVDNRLSLQLDYSF